MPLPTGIAPATHSRMEVNPTSGDTITFSPPYDQCLITKATTTAALTFVLPPTPNDGDMVHISTVAAITASTVTGGQPKGYSGAHLAGEGVTFMYSATSGWFKF